MDELVLAPQRCARYFRLSAMLSDICRAIAEGGAGDEAAEQEKEILATFQVHMEVCPACQAWLKMMALVGLNDPERNCEE